MDSLVLELQRDCLDEGVSLKSLARKALVITQKLNLDEAWLLHEINGYQNEDVPAYRNLAGQLVAKDPRQGYIPVELPRELDVEMNDFPMGQSIAEIESTLSFKGGFVYLALPNQIQQDLRQLYSRQVEFHYRIPLSRINALLEQVRNRILDFAVQLERKNILGSGMSFNHQEKQKAQMMTINVHGDFQGIMGDVTNSNVTQNITKNNVQGNFEELTNLLKQNSVSDDDISDLKTAIENDGQAIVRADEYGPEVTSWFKKMMGKAIEGSWGVSIATAGNVLGAALNTYFLGG